MYKGGTCSFETVYWRHPFKNFHSVEVSDSFCKIMHFIIECITIKSFDCKSSHVSLSHLFQFFGAEVESMVEQWRYAVANRLFKYFPSVKPNFRFFQF